MQVKADRPRRLESYIGGVWTRGAKEGVPLLDASTGTPVALIDSTGIDFAAALAYGRDKAGPALRRMSFHERAAMLKALAQALMERKEEFYALSTATGATRTDSWVDIEGGIGTLFSYASKGRRELPNARVLVEGDVEALSRDDTFSARHIMTPLQGVAVHINAFNFPCWGMLEKLAPTLLAGMPAIVKPASQTAYLAELMVRRMVETGLLPEGAVQLVCGSLGDLLDRVEGQDVVTFTGSAETGRGLKTHPRIVANTVRFTMEADSLNAAVLGLDAAPGTEEFDLFVKEVAREMTAKAGQKCTAIRRVIAPRAHCGALVAALGERLGKVALGNPADDSVRMGPLASLGQREEVRARIRELVREAEIVVGDPAKPRVVSGDAEAGAFLNPVLFFSGKPHDAQAIHDVEAFGPVSTVMPYDTAEEAVELVKRGKGSLVTSVFTNDPRLAEELVLGMAPFHGRVMIGNRVSAKSSTGHGSPLPGLVHGGPGRAGGGEELGGMRGVKHYMQRTAVQGAPALLSAVTGRWVEGTPARTDGEHPFRKSLAELRIGDQL
ncbi:MAG TPA: phenylacetic acid degradation bifunctional protein PaaZ, partial [Sinorhizobium sp.]|nr:phenylacetic acid degradation bifunctional protein PaaZ [Sinorhizobium sp.]